MSEARCPRGVSSTMYGIKVMAAVLRAIVQPSGCSLAHPRATVELRVLREEASMGAVEREVTVPAPPGEVWRAVTQSDEVSQWFGADAELEVRPGGRGTFRWHDGTERYVVVEEVEPALKLSFRWLPFERTG